MEPIILDHPLSKAINDKIILFGFGRVGRQAAEFALKHGYQIIEIWDNNSTETSWNGISICKPHKLNYTESESVDVIISASSINYFIREEMQQQATTLGITHTHHFAELFFNKEVSWDEYCEFFEYISEYRVFSSVEKAYNYSIGRISLVITDCCTLKCEDCAVHMPYFHQPKNQPVEIQLRALFNLLDCVDYIGKIDILGGEPFLCPDLYQYIQILSNHPKVGTLSIITNGTIVPNGKNLECLKSSKVQVTISDYGTYSKHLNTIMDLCREIGVPCKKFPYSQWSKAVFISKQHRTQIENEQILRECVANGCHFVKDGKLFKCTRMPSLWSLQAIPEEDIEFVDLIKSCDEALRDQLKQYLKLKSLKACDYCLGFGTHTSIPVPAAKQADHPLSY